MEDGWNADEDLISLVLVEPSARQLSSSVRFRAFTGCGGESGDADNSVPSNTWQLARRDDLGIHKKRRLDDVLTCEVGDVVQPVLRVLQDTFDIARRRLETLHWLDKTRSAEEISARFALDRRLGVTPSLAATHKALSRLQQLHRTEAITDLAEDLVMDSPTISIWTLLQIVEGLKGQPQCAARIVFSLAPLITNGSVPTSVWTSLCCELDKVARQLPAPLERPLVELFGEVLYRARDDGPVNGTIVVCYGQALLKSRAPIRSIVGLVQAELLSGRNTPPADAVSEARLGAFLSDLIQVMCAPGGGAVEREEGLPLSTKERLMHCGDLVKHVYAGRLRLTQDAFDAFLRFCDESKDYHRLCIVFLAMCVLSIPTLSSVTRVAEVLCDIQELSDYLAGVLHQMTPSLMLYLFLRYGPSSLFLQAGGSGVRARNGSGNIGERVKLESHLCGCAARLCARDGDELVCMALFDAVISVAGPNGARAFMCEMAKVLQCQMGLFGGRSTPASAAEAMEPYNMEALYYILCPSASACSGEEVSVDTFRASFQGRALSSLFVGRDTMQKISGVTVNQALLNILTSPQIYCTVLDVSALCSLTKSAPLADAFAKMMNGYATKMGAITFVPFDACASEQLTDEGKGFLFMWLLRHSWLVVFPLSLTVQLCMESQQGTPQQQRQPDGHHRTQLSSVRLFHAIRGVGHSRVAFIADLPSVVEEAKAAEVHPIITLSDLAARLVRS